MGLSPASLESTPRVKLTRASRPPGAKRPQTTLTPGTGQKKQKSEKRILQETLKKGNELVQDASFEHREFQKAHVADQEPCVAGHWHAFLQALVAATSQDASASAILTCACCRRLRAKVLQALPDVSASASAGSAHASDPASGSPVNPQRPQQLQLMQVVPVDAADAAAGGHGGQMVQGPRVHNKGRPKKSEKVGDRWSLHIFIAAERAWCYAQTAESFTSSVTYYCRACNRKIQFKSATCPHKIEKHEEAEKHQKGVARLQSARAGPTSAVLPLRDVEEMEEPRQPQIPAASSGPAACAVSPVPKQAPSEAYKCVGVPASNNSFPLHRLQSSVVKFMTAGQPRTVFLDHERDPLQGCFFVGTSAGFVVQAKDCLGTCKRIDVACRRCRSLAESKDFQKHLASKAYHVDLVRLAWMYFHCPDEEVADFVASMRASDYAATGYAGNDLGSIVGSANKMEAVRRIRAKFTTIPVWRLSASMKNFLDSQLVETPCYHNTDTQAIAHASLAMSLSEAVAKGEVHKMDLQLGALVATGGLRADSLVNSMVTSFLQMLSKSLAKGQGKRQTTSEYVDQTALMEAVSSLGRGKEVQAMFARFGVNPQCLPKVQFGGHEGSALPRLPHSYCTLRDPDLLGKNFQQIAASLQSAGERLHMIVDETVWSKDLLQVRGLGPSGEDLLVGGSWDKSPEQDYSNLDPAKWCKQTVPAEALARTSLHVCLQRVDTCKWVWDLLHLPRPTAIGNAQVVLDVVAETLAIVTNHNANIPPSGLAFDGGTANSKLSAALCGLLPEAEMKRLPFFRECSLSRPNLRYWPFSEVRFQGRFLLRNNNGSYHINKRFALQHSSGGRKIRWADVYVDLSSLLLEKLPPKAYACADVMNDKHAIMKLSPPFIGRSWSALACHVPALVAALFCSATSGSCGFTKAEICTNAFSAYHLVLLQRAHNWARRRELSESLATVTFRNVAMLCGHCVASSLCDVEPRHLTEIGIEQHFSRVKASFTGQPTLRDCQFGILKLHAKQAQELSRMSPEQIARASHHWTTQSRTPLNQEDLQRFCNKSLSTAIQFWSWFCQDLTPADVLDNLHRFWRSESHRLFPTGAQEDPLDPEAEVDELTPDLQEMIEVLDNTDEKQQSQYMQTLQMLHDRAVLSEEVQLLLQPAQPATEPTGADGQIGQDVGAHPLNAEASGPSTDQLNRLIPAEPEREGEQPKTLIGVVMNIANKKQSCLQVGEPCAAGEYNLLRRMRLAIGPCRQFIRLARLEEGLLPASVLEYGSAPLNSWNEREHQLAMSRKAADHSAQRTSRSSAWLAVTRKLVHSIQKEVRGCISEIVEFRPYGASPQVLAFKTETGDNRVSKVQMGVAMSVHRGSICKKGDSVHLRTSYPCAFPLPAYATKKVHVSLLSLWTPSEGAAPEQPTWVTSCASEIVLLDPVGTVLGELDVTISETSTRLHVKLSPTATEALEKLSTRRLPNPGPEEAPAEAPPMPAPSLAPSDLAFNDRCFTKLRLSAEVQKFFVGLEAQYLRAGLRPHEDGHLKLNGQKHAWKEIVDRVASFFLSLPELADARGYKFSSKVYTKLKSLLPTQGRL